MAKGDYKSNLPRKSRQPTDNDRLRAALAACVAEMVPMTEPCEHAVGICWCSWHCALDNAKRLLEAHERSERFIAELEG